MYTKVANTVLLLAAAGRADELAPLLSKMDVAALQFKSMTAKVKRVAHTAVINEDNADSGAFSVKRSKGNELRMLSEVVEPDPKSVAYQGRKLEIYYPKIQTVQEFDVGKNKVVEQFFLLGFGTPRKELERDYAIKLTGTETIGGQKTARLELTPKSAQMMQHIKKVELWISEVTGYPLQQKFHQSGGDYNLVSYTDTRINPDLPDAALKLKLPRNVKREMMSK